MMSLQHQFVWIVALAISCSLVPICRAFLTADEKQELLNAHNHFRRSASPTPSNMEKLEWNDELAYLAQFWAATCMYEEERESLNDQSTEFDYVGENKLAVASYTVNYTILIQTWFNQGVYYNYEYGTCTDEDGEEDEDGEACREYIQLVWARTYAVGCASVRCEELNAEDVEENGLFLLCFYGPGGNFVGEQPYQSGGGACSNCPYEKPACENKLCVEESGAPPLLSHISLTAMLLVVKAVSSLVI